MGDNGYVLRMEALYLGNSDLENLLKSGNMDLEKQNLPVLEISEDFRVKNQKNLRY